MAKSALAPAATPAAPRAIRRHHLPHLTIKAWIGLCIIALFVIMAVFAPMIAPGNPNAETFLPDMPPSAANPLGTTALGQDVFRQVVWGARNSLLVSVVAGSLATFIAVLVGITAGFLGGWADRVLSFVITVFLVIPGLPLLIVLSSYVPSKGQGVIIFVLAITGWAWGARTLRSQVLSLRERDYVLHARLVGQPWYSIVFAEILPNMASLVVNNLLFAMIGSLLAAAGLDFLGLGNVSAVSWGTMLYWAQNNAALLNGLWWWFIPPGLAITLYGGGLALLNFSLDEITNPRLRKRVVKVHAE